MLYISTMVVKDIIHVSMDDLKTPEFETPDERIEMCKSIISGLEIPLVNYRMKHGRLPKKLSSLKSKGFVDTVPMSPVGRKLGYKKVI